MRKIPTLFVRDPENRANVLDEVTPGCEWVLEGEGKATRKYDGTCMMLDTDGKWWARREVKPGKLPPLTYVYDNFDEVTGKTQGWEPVAQSPFAKFHAEAVHFSFPYPPGTYELIGPKVQGNPEKVKKHMLIAHAAAQPVRLAPDLHDAPKMWVRYLSEDGWEGVVWHHPDGRMAKLKAKDLTDILG
jgi:hypothetical protein